MPFNADMAGQAFGPHPWRPTPRLILAFKAVLSPDRPQVLDDTAPGGLFASPLHCVTPEWALTLTLRADPRQTLTDDEARRGVHIGQDSRFLGPARADERLAVRARLESVRQSRAGVVAVTRFTGAGVETGAPVWESFSTSLHRGVALTGDDRGQAHRPTFDADLDDAAEAPIPLAAGLPHLYSECAEIWNPIHTERRVALAAGLADILVHGTALWALAGVALTDAYADGDEMRLARLACAFVGQARPGQVARLKHHAVEGGVAWRLDSEAGAPLVVGRAEFHPA